MRRRGIREIREIREMGRILVTLIGLMLLSSVPVLEVGASAPASNTLWGTTRVVDNKALILWETEPALGGQENTPAGEKEQTDTGRQIAKYRLIDGQIVADQAYYKREDLTGLVLPATVKEIGMFAFARSGIRKIDLPHGLETIGMGAFYHCDSLESVTLPETVSHIEPMAFDKTLWIKNFLDKSEEDFLIEGDILLAYKGTSRVVEIPEGVRLVGPMVFAGHEEIERVVMPESVVSIEEGAFQDCSRLKEVVWNQGLETIRDRAFVGCGMESMTLPKSLKRLGVFALDPDVTVKVGNGTEEPDLGTSRDVGIATIIETDMEYLTNEAYGGGKGENGLRILAPEGVEASLDGLRGEYSLVVETGPGDEKVKKAYSRCMGQELPAGAVCYFIQLKEETRGVLIKQLGKEPMSLTLPHIPKEAVFYTLDRNGQLERIEIGGVGEQVTGEEQVMFRLYHLYGPLIVLGQS